MNKFARYALTTALVLAASPLAIAQDDDLSLISYRSGLYISGTAGYTFDYNIVGNELIGTSDETTYELDADSAFTGAVGVYLGQARAELEIGFREADFEDFNPTSLGFNLDGDLEYFTVMGNIFYDIPTDVPNLDLYVGGGLGVAIVTGDATFDPPITVSVIGGAGSATTERFDDTNQTFAYQFMGGLSYEVVDNVTVFGGYRIRLYSEFSDDNSLLNFREHVVHAAEVGLRIDF